MGPERRNQLALGALAVVILVVAFRAWTRTSAAPVSSSNEREGVTTAPRRPAAATAAPDVHLPLLEAKRPKPAAGERNLFRFKPKAPPPPPAPTVGVAPPATPAGPPPPPPLPPITLKFIGIVDTPGREKFAVLSDGRNVFHGREGDIIEGRFRILRIGAESIEMAYLDGRGRQTIRLTGG